MATKGTRVRNAIGARQTKVDVPASRLKIEIARILKEEGYINSFTTKGDAPKYVIRIFLRYDAKGASSITHLSRVSRPGRRVYVGAGEIPKVLGGYGVFAVVIIEMFIPRVLSTLLKSISGKINCSRTPSV